MKKRKNKLKEELMQTSDRYKSAVNEDLDQLVDRFKTIATTAIAMGLGFILLYQVVSYLMRDKSKNQPSHSSDSGSGSSFFGTFRNLLIKELIVIVLGMLQSKVISYLENLKKDNEEDDSEQS